MSIEHNNLGQVTGIGGQLEDGFQEMFTFRGHRLQLRGFNLVEWNDDNRRHHELSVKQQFISWDIKQALLWRSETPSIQTNPLQHQHYSLKISSQVKFSNQPNFICSIAAIPRMKVFLAAALDMSFKVFDKTLNQLESIHHDERAILQLEYDQGRDFILSSGATGILVWRLTRDPKVDNGHIMEKLFAFDGCDTWITHMIYEPLSNRVYAIKERSAQVLSVTRREVITTLDNVHEAPINVVCWYERNQFYITGCSRGEIKCWTSNYSQKSLSGSNAGGNLPFQTKIVAQTGLRTSAGSAGNNNQKTFALLHTFTGHTKSVTAIRLHPVSGLAISAGMDGFVKVLNLEALNELFSVHLDAGILSMRIISLGYQQFACLMALTDATIKLWKITSVCDFFAVASSKIQRLLCFENLEAELEHHHRMKLASASGPWPKSNPPLDAPRPPTQQQDQTAGQEKAAATTKSARPITADSEFSADLNSKTTELPATAEKPPSSKPPPITAEPAPDGGSLSDKILVTYSTQDLRAFNQHGAVLGRLEPEYVVDGIKAFSVSVFQKLLFCLCEGDRVRVFDLRRFTFPLIKEFSLQEPMDSTVNDAPNKSTVDAGAGVAHIFDATSSPLKGKSQGLSEAKDSFYSRVEDLGECCVLVDVAPTLAVRAPKAEHLSPSLSPARSRSKLDGESDLNAELLAAAAAAMAQRRKSGRSFFSKSRRGTQSPRSPTAAGRTRENFTMDKTDARGEPVPDYLECYYVVGLRTGALLFLDTLNQFEVQLNFQAHNGVIQELKYHRRYRDLFILGKDFSEAFTTVRIFRLPDLDFITEVKDLHRVSCFSISPSLPFFSVGLQTGGVRLFNVNAEDRTAREIYRPGDDHEGEVSSICFCDDLRVFCSAGVDSKVKFWDYERRAVRTIILNLPTCAVVSSGGAGDVVMAQNHYLLTIPRRIWDEGDILANLKLQESALQELEDLTGGDGHLENKQHVRRKTHHQHGQQLNVESAGVYEEAQESNKHNHAEKNAMSRGRAGSPQLLSEVVQTHERRLSRRMSRNVTTASPPQSVNSLQHLDTSSSQLQHTEKTAEQQNSTFDPNQTRVSINQKLQTLFAESSVEKNLLLPQIQDYFYYYTATGQMVQRTNLTGESVHAKMSKYSSGHGARQEMHEEVDNHEYSVPIITDKYAAKWKAKAKRPSNRRKQPAAHAEELSTEQSLQVGAAEVMDVLHPRFLLQKKPTPKLFKLEDVAVHVSSLLREASVDADTTSVHSLDHQVVPEAPSTARKAAQLGMSPRARLTLLSSNAKGTAQPRDSSQEYLSNMSKPMQSKFSARSEKSEHGNSDDASENLAEKIESQMVETAALSSKVSDVYRLHRQSRLETDKKRQQLLRKSVLASVQASARKPVMRKLVNALQEAKDALTKAERGEAVDFSGQEEEFEEELYRDDRREDDSSAADSPAASASKRHALLLQK